MYIFHFIVRSCLHACPFAENEWDKELLLLETDNNNHSIYPYTFTLQFCSIQFSVP